MTDYSNIVTDDHRTLDGASNGGTPYDELILDIDEDGSVSLGTITRHGGDATPVEIWHGRVQRYVLASGKGGGVHITLDKLRADLADGGKISSRVDRIKAGQSVEWDGNNMSGRLTDDAREAASDLSDWLYPDPNRYIDDSWATWDVSAWLANSAHEILPTMGDDAIATWASEVETSAKSDRVRIVGDVLEWAQSIREEKRAELAATDD